MQMACLWVFDRKKLRLRTFLQKNNDRCFLACGYLTQKTQIWNIWNHGPVDRCFQWGQLADVKYSLVVFDSIVLIHFCPLELN